MGPDGHPFQFPGMAFDSLGPMGSLNLPGLPGMLPHLNSPLPHLAGGSFSGPLGFGPMGGLPGMHHMPLGSLRQRPRKQPPERCGTVAAKTLKTHAKPMRYQWPRNQQPGSCLC
jgi:hypothetical protein